MHEKVRNKIAICSSVSHYSFSDSSNSESFSLGWYSSREVYSLFHDFSRRNNVWYATSMDYLWDYRSRSTRYHRSPAMVNRPSRRRYDAKRDNRHGYRQSDHHIRPYSHCMPISQRYHGLSYNTKRWQQSPYITNKILSWDTIRMEYSPYQRTRQDM